MQRGGFRATLGVVAIFDAVEQLRMRATLSQHRDGFFFAAKTRNRAYAGAWKDLRHSLDRLRVERVDLWQMHSLTGPEGWERAMGPGGVLQAFVKAREKGLVRFLGVTGQDLQRGFL